MRDGSAEGRLPKPGTLDGASDRCIPDWLRVQIEEEPSVELSRETSKPPNTTAWRPQREWSRKATTAVGGIGRSFYRCTKAGAARYSGRVHLVYEYSDG